jgi:hypothetical protein
LRTSSNMLQANSSFLHKMLFAYPVQARNFSVAFNIRSKFEDAYEKKLKA